MKKIAMSLGMIAFVGAVVAGSTGAFFSDVETSTGNTFTAGALDLKVDSQCHYYQNNIDVGCSNPGEEGPVAFGAWAETDLIPGVHKFFAFGDIKPGDRGENTISLHVYDNDAWGGFWVTRASSTDLDNTCTEPEGGAELMGASSTPGCDVDGELDDAMVGKVWLDQGAIAGFQNVGPNGVVYDNDGVATGTQLVDVTEGDNVWQEGEPVLNEQGGFFNTFHQLSTVLMNARASSTEVCENAPANGQVPGTNGQPYGVCNGLATDGRMVGSTTYYIGWEWSLPAAVGNEVQTDSIGGDVEFRVVQHRNNPSQDGLMPI